MVHETQWWSIGVNNGTWRVIVAHRERVTVVIEENHGTYGKSTGKLVLIAPGLPELPA